MCGIAGVVGEGSSLRPLAIETMANSLSHRGPDARQLARLPGCHLGHARLSVLDLAGGQQPMQSADGRFWIVFNGEIYNYRELRQELSARGQLFRTHSDTEVVLAAFAEWGADCVNRFRGMFAFAIWSVSERQLFLARDLLGEKPLYYAVHDASIYFASELKAIQAAGLHHAIDFQSLDAYLGLGYVPPDRSIWRDVLPLPPGHCLLWTEKQLKISRYWTPPLSTHQIGLDDAAARIRELLSQAVRRQLVSDVPIGAFLSGGQDSCSVVALMSRHTDHPVKTFSVGFGEYINELGYARLTAGKYRTEHHEIDLGRPAVAELLPKMAQVYDEPFADSSAIPTYLISAFARQHVKVVLSGDGGDELFGGYSWYNALAMSEDVGKSRLEWLITRMASAVLRDRNVSLRRRAHALGLAARWDDVWERTVMSQTYFRAEERSRMLPPQYNQFAQWPGALYRPEDSVTGLNRAFYFDLASYLPGDILVKVDRASMAHGLECRAPFLDRDLVEFALSLPQSLKVRGSENKVALKQAVGDLWPAEIVNRPKQGFGAPYAKWLQIPSVRELLLEVDRPGSRLREILPGLSRRWHERLSYKTWMLLVLGLWLDTHKAAT